MGAFWILAATLLTACAGTQNVQDTSRPDSAASKHSVVRPNGFVPDSATAARIAEAVWIPIYGAEQIAAERPFHAVLANDVWTVGGSLAPGKAGGVAVAEIAKSDGRIIRISHGR